MADLVKASGAAVRAADALLRGVGGRAVLLRLPAPAVPADASEQLGLAVPDFQDVELAPVVIRRGKTAGTKELLISATAVNTLVGSLAYAASDILFAVAYGVLIDSVLMEILAYSSSEAGGVVYVYRLTVKIPQTVLL